MYWWSDVNPPDIRKPSRQMGKELIQMKALFDTTAPTIYKASTRWDRDAKIITLEKNLNLDDSRHPYWEFVFQMSGAPGEPRANFLPQGKKFVIKVAYTSNYPDSAPQVVVDADEFRGYDHILTTNDDVGFSSGYVLCLESHNGARTGWDPAKSTAATYALWGIQWIRAYYYKHANGRSSMPAAS